MTFKPACPCWVDRVDAGMCRLLNNFGEIAVRVLERHIDLAVRLEEARQTARQLSDETAYNSQSLLEPVKVLESCPVEDVKTDQQQQRQVMVKGREGSSLDKTGAALVAKEGGWMQQLQGAGPGAEAAAVAAACQSYGAWWGDEASSAAAASAAAAAAVAKAKGKVGLGEEKIGALQRARNPQLQLCNVFQREVRDTARTADACVLLVDTGHPDWPVIYADETWKEWAGGRAGWKRQLILKEQSWGCYSRIILMQQAARLIHFAHLLAYFDCHAIGEQQGWHELLQVVNWGTPALTSAPCPSISYLASGFWSWLPTRLVM
eukprot:1161091-Pelagomonas_calceolata.AAC.8